jgi:hypothetical protein
MPNEVIITGPPNIFVWGQYNGEPVYGWTFPVIVNGQAGVYTIYTDTGNPADLEDMRDDVIEELENNPGAMEGIVENDPYPGEGDYGGYGDYADFYGDFEDDGEGGDGDESIAIFDDGSVGDSV